MGLSKSTLKQAIRIRTPRALAHHTTITATRDDMPPPSPRPATEILACLPPSTRPYPSPGRQQTLPRLPGAGPPARYHGHATGTVTVITPATAAARWCPGRRRTRRHRLASAGIWNAVRLAPIHVRCGKLVPHPARPAGVNYPGDVAYLDEARDGIPTLNCFPSGVALCLAGQAIIRAGLLGGRADVAVISSSLPVTCRSMADGINSAGGFA